MSVTIRIAIKNDFQSIYSLMLEFAIFQKTPEKVSITLEQMIANQGLYNAFVAELEDGQIIGFASYFHAYYSWSGKALYLDDLYVQPAFQGQGIGKKLLMLLVEFARSANCYKIRWLVSKWNTNAQEFYKSMGASIDGTDFICDLLL